MYATIEVFECCGLSVESQHFMVIPLVTTTNYTVIPPKKKKINNSNNYI